MKRLISVLLVATIFIGVFSFSTAALTSDENFTGYETPVRYASTSRQTLHGKDILSRILDIRAFTNTILSGVSKCSPNIDVSKYNITYNDLNVGAIRDYIWYNLPEAFNVYALGFSFSDSGRISDVCPSYYNFSDTKREYTTCHNKMVAGGDKLLAGIEGNDALDDVQKALLLHDRLALWNEYDYERLETMDDEIFTAFGALGERRSVCQGYAMAYMYLLDRVGIKNYYCSSEDLNHGWNIIYINNKPYHVDVTWDDYDWGNGDGLSGGVGHTNFLRSSQGMYDIGHEALDYDFSPVDETYDNYFWQNSAASFELLNNEIYYIDYTTEQIKKYSDKSAIYNFNQRWYYYEDAYTYYDLGNYSTLANDGEALLYTLPNGVYRLDVKTRESQQVYDANLSGNLSIYGMVLEEGYLICDINEVPPYIEGFSYDNVYQVKVKYAQDEPEVVGIEIVSLPNKTDYIVGEELVLDGLTINLIYSDETKQSIDEGFTISGFNSSLVGSQILTVSYGDFAVTFSVVVKNKYGDANVDGDVDAKDYAIILQYLNGWNVDIDVDAADANGDGDLNAKDYAVLFQFLSGWPITLGPK